MHHQAHLLAHNIAVFRQRERLHLLEHRGRFTLIEEFAHYQFVVGIATIVSNCDNEDGVFQLGLSHALRGHMTVLEHAG